MPIEYIRRRLEEESKLVPFTVFSVIVFWSVAVAMGASAFWFYPAYVEASEVKQELVMLKKEFAVYRIEDRMASLQDEQFKIEREMEQIRLRGEDVPAIYFDQRSRIITEIARLQRRLNEMFRGDTELAAATDN